MCDHTRSLGIFLTLSAASLDQNFNPEFKCNFPLCNWFRRGDGMVTSVCVMRREIVSKRNRIWLCLGLDCRFHICRAFKKGAAAVTVTLFFVADHYIDNCICVKIARSI